MEGPPVNDDYLWDGSGEPDPEVRRLEKLLGRFRRDPRRAAPWLERLPVKRPAISRVAILAAAAALVIALIGLRFAGGHGAQGWKVVRLEGAPRVGSSRIAGTGTLTVGEWIETDSTSRAEIEVGAIGQASIEPNTRMRLVKAERTDHRLALVRGTLHVRIWAPPRLFYVDTPSATAVDLGCTYTLTVDEAGAGLLHVATGWVAFDSGGRESFVPAGAVCATRPGIGPGTPCFEDAARVLREALERLDFGREEPAARARSLEVVLEQARARDALTLWHLLSRVEGDERGQVYDRLAALVPPPAGVSREGVLRGDREMSDRWWDELGLGVTTWWRLWKTPGPPRSGDVR